MWNPQLSSRGSNKFYLGACNIHVRGGSHSLLEIFGYFWAPLKVFSPHFFSKSAGPRLSQGAGNGNSEVGGWMEEESSGERGQQPAGSGRNPALDPIWIPSGSKGSSLIWKRTSDFLGIFLLLLHTHTYKIKQTILSF